MTELITASAAIAAAIFGFVNVIVSSRLAGRAQDKQWRRDSVKVTMSNFLSTTGRLSNSQPLLPLSAGSIDDLTKEMNRLIVEAEEKFSELEIIATVECVKSAGELMEALQSNVRFRLSSQDKDLDWSVISEYSNRIAIARSKFIMACRADLEVGIYHVGINMD